MQYSLSKNLRCYNLNILHPSYINFYSISPSSLVDEQAEIIAVQMLVDRITPESYFLLSVVSKAEYFEFNMTDNNYNLNLYKEGYDEDESKDVQFRIV